MLRFLTGRITLYGLLASHVALLFAPFLAPYDPVEQFREHVFAPPSTLHFIDRAGHFHFRPFIETGDSATGDSDGFSSPVQFLQSGAPYRLLGFIPGSVHFFGVKEPGRIFLLGADGYGRDQLSRFLYGGQISVAVGVLAASLTLAVGALAGLFAGFYGGWRDGLLMRGSEVFLALPWVYLLLGLRAFLPLTASPKEVLFLLVAVIGVLGWARPARLIRGIVMSAKILPYVSAAEQFGASRCYLMRRHLLPETYGVLLAQAALLIPQYIAAEVTLSFLGLGISEPLSSWGSMLSAMRELSIVASYWWMSLPALALVPFFFSYQLLAQRIQDKAVRRS
jgi:peptide/nickel transport system permease protein